LNNRREIVKIGSISTLDEQNNEVILDILQEMIYLYSQDDLSVISGQQYMKTQITHEDVNQLYENEFVTESGKLLRRNL